jgi:hypothetical protein
MKSLDRTAVTPFRNSNFHQMRQAYWVAILDLQLGKKTALLSPETQKLKRRNDQDRANKRN